MKNKTALKILALLGFGTVATGCEIIVDIGNGNQVAEYGCPTAIYEVKGKVTDADKNPIAGIKVSMLHTYEGYEQIDTLISQRTDAAGVYKFTTDAFPDSEFPIVAEDTDGEANGGTFAKAETTLITSHDDYVDGDGNWYWGKVQKTVDFELKKEE